MLIVEGEEEYIGRDCLMIAELFAEVGRIGRDCLMTAELIIGLIVEEEIGRS